MKSPTIEIPIHFSHFFSSLSAVIHETWIYQKVKQPTGRPKARIKMCFLKDPGIAKSHAWCFGDCMRSLHILFEVLGMSMEWWKLKLSIFSWRSFSLWFFCNDGDTLGMFIWGIEIDQVSIVFWSWRSGLELHAVSHLLPFNGHLWTMDTPKPWEVVSSRKSRRMF